MAFAEHYLIVNLVYFANETGHRVHRTAASSRDPTAFRAKAIALLARSDHASGELRNAWDLVGMATRLGIPLTSRDTGRQLLR